MCGIAGVVRQSTARSSRTRLRRLSDALAHRGPDGAGVWRSAGGDVAAGPHVGSRSSIPVRPARSRWRRPTAGTASCSTARSTTTASCAGRSKHAASGSRPAATPKCCCGCSRATAPRRSRGCAGCSRSRGGTPATRAGRSRAIASASSRCMSRRPTGSIAFASEIHALVSARDWSSAASIRPASWDSWRGAPCRRR